MTGSMYASIAGLKAHMQKLTVIGNNVANVNTQGYKRQRTIFRDSVYSMYNSGSNGTEVVGGMNPSQLGYGSLVASIDLDMSSASYAPGNPTDCALVGDGFFMVGDKETVNTIDASQPESFKSLTLTRVGDFYFGPDGYLVDGRGNVVYGFMNTGNGYKVDPKNPDKKIPDICDQLVPIRLPHWEKVKVTDADGNETDEYKYVTRYAQMYKGENNAGYPAAGENGSDGIAADAKRQTILEDYAYSQDVPENAPEGTMGEALDFAQFSSISIDQGSGCISGIRMEGDEPVTIGYLAIGSVTNPNGVSHVDSSYYRCQEGAGELRIGMIGGVNKDLGLSTVNSYQFQEAAGGTPDPNTPTPEPPAGAAIVNNGGTKMMVGFLESSNVDLATEISELITTQRGYQANTRIITVTDSMLEELVNMKR